MKNMSNLNVFDLWDIKKLKKNEQDMTRDGLVDLDEVADDPESVQRMISMNDKLLQHKARAMSGADGSADGSWKEEN